ncbi:MAG TPA: rhombosortase [Gammaproteobacteria bacterium]|nr:rhombosortase [Gammaproteobacteria bacterium]
MNISSSHLLKQWGLPVLLILIALLFQLTGKSGFKILCYNREQIIAWQWWRLFTGHLVHISWMHFFMNTLALILIQLLFSSFLSPWRLLLLIMVSASGIDLGLLLFNPEIKWYAGLSGVLHGLIAAGAVMLISKDAVKGAALLIVLIFKLSWEQFVGSLPGSAEWTGAAVITDAHLYGAISGAIAAIFIIGISHKEGIQ